jgi:multicomponent Na+:H+ antiporter subunit F
MMSVQLFGTAGIAALLLLGAAIGAAAVVDLALILAVLAAFAALAFVKTGVRPGGDPAEPEDRA